MEVLVPSPETTLLILLGASAWPFSPEFQPSEAFANAARGLKAYFLNPRPFGLPNENLLDLFDSNQSPDELDVDIRHFLEQRLATMKASGHAARDILVYFVGHGGFVGRDADFYLATRRTRMDNPHASGMQMISLAHTLTEKTRHLRRIIILDCCFAAAAFSAFQSEPAQVALEKTSDAFASKRKGMGFPEKGTALLCSSNHKSPSLLLPDGSSTMFTKALVDALMQGTTPELEYLSLREVADLAAESLMEIRNAPRPVVHSPDQSEGDIADIPFFPNPRAEEGRARQEEEQRRRAEEERARQAEEEARRKAEQDRLRKREEEAKSRLAEEEQRHLTEELTPWDYLDFELKIARGGGRRYPIDVRSEAGEVSEIMKFPFGKLALENQLLRLQNALLSSGGRRRRMPSPDERAVQDFGKALFESLFIGKVRSLYAVSWDKASVQGKGLRVQLRIQDPALAALPWEFLYDPGQAEYLCLSRNTPLVRYIELPHPRQSLPVSPPLRILGMIASPQNLTSLDIENERKRIERAIKDLRARGSVSLTWLRGQTWQDLQQAMRRGPWHIFHFVGHGGFDSETDEGLIALTNSEGQAQHFTATHLARLLADHGPLRLVVLNSCEGARAGNIDIFSSTAAILVRRGIPAVLAMQYEITDGAAIVLSQAFYEAITDGLPVDAAVGEARKAISIGIANTIEWGTPVLYMHSSNGEIFQIGRSSSPIQDRSSTLAPGQAQTSSRDLESSVFLEQAESQLSEHTVTPQKTKEEWLNEGNRLYVLNPPEEALAAYEQALRLDPNYALAYFNKGFVLEDLECPEEALDAYEETLRLDPNHKPAYKNRAYLLITFKRYEEALAAYEQALRLDPNDGDAYFGKGLALEKLDRKDEAQQAYRRAHQLGHRVLTS